MAPNKIEELVITKDEVFIIFYKLDKDGDGVLNYSEVCDCFIPREDEYATMINSLVAHRLHSN